MDHSRETHGREETSHVPVMMREVIEHLDPQSGDVVVDGTLGLGGHAAAILKRIGPQGRLIGIDRDAQALAVARENLKMFEGQCDLIHANYAQITKVLEGLGIEKVDRIVFDLGLSSFQLNDPERGFSFRSDGPLDMRMDQDSYISAFDLVNSLSEKELAAILRDFGQERWHHRIARYVVQRRSEKPIETTKELSDIIMRAMPRNRSRERIHPATRAFQAFRIAVNRELEGLEEALEQCLDALCEGGRIAVIAFHSLEDRIVKQAFREWTKSGNAKLIVKKPLRPSEQEAQENARARSARLRIAERT